MINLEDILKSNIIKQSSKGSLNFLYEDIIELFTEPDCFLEIGAFEASFSIKMRDKYPNSSVYAFEAGTPNYNYHKSKIDYQSKNINYLNLAVSDKNEFVDFYIRKDSDSKQVFGANGIVKRSEESSYTDIIKVESISLDSFLEKQNLINHTKCMWIDVEGSAKKVFSGAEKSLENTLSILIEVEEYPYWENQWMRKDIENYLESKNFFPIARDFEDNLQYDVIFVKENILDSDIIENKIRKYFDSLSLSLEL